MASDFSVRQLLACFNISVFDPVMEPALKRVCRIEDQQESGSKSRFCGMVPLTGMALASFLCFYGLSSFSFVAGAILFSVCGLALRKTKSDEMRFFLKTYILSGLFLLMRGLFSISPELMTACLFVCLFYCLFLPAARCQRFLLSAFFFCGVCFLCRDFLFLTVGVFSVSGTIGLLFPVKNIYGRETGFVFTILPLFLILAVNVLALLGVLPPVRGGRAVLILFTADLLLLFLGLWRDMEAGEIFLFFAGMILLFVCGLVFSAGIQGSFVLFLIAFFIHSPLLGKIAAVLFSCFLTLFFLSMPVSLLWGAIICAVTGIALGLFRYRSGRFASKEK